jgi:putative ABC transport system permease protein
MGLLFSLSLRNALRNRRRSALTALTVTLGVALLTVAMAWIGGVFGGILEMASNSAGQVRVVTPKYAQKEQMAPLYENMPSVDPLLTAIRGAPGVTGAWPRIVTGATATPGEEIGEHFGPLIGAPVEYLDAVMKLDQKVASGGPLRTDDEILLGKTFAAQIGAKAGDRITILGMTQDGSPSGAVLTCVGTVDLGGAQNRFSFVTLARAQLLTDMDGGATELLVFGDDYEQAGLLATELRELPALDGLDVTSWDQRPPFDGMLSFARGIHRFAAAVIVFITALGVLNTMLMSVLERTAEIGVMRAMGLRRWQAVSLFVMEAMGISSIGGVVGAAAGALIAWYIQVHGVNLGSSVSKMPASIPINETVYARLTPGILVGAIILGFVMAVVGGALPAIRAARIQPIEAMRQRR